MKKLLFLSIVMAISFTSCDSQKTVDEARDKSDVNIEFVSKEDSKNEVSKTSDDLSKKENQLNNNKENNEKTEEIKTNENNDNKSLSSQKTEHNAKEKEELSSDNYSFENDENSDKEYKKDDNKTKDMKNVEKIKSQLVDLGKFDEKLLGNLTDDKLTEYYEKAKKDREKTGYFNVRNLVFQQIAKDNPKSSKLFPLEYIETRYKYEKSKEGEITDKYRAERDFMINSGYNPQRINQIDDKMIEENLHKIYEKDDSLLWEDNVKELINIFENTFNDFYVEAQKPQVTSKHADFRKQLVEIYGFDQNVVDNIPDSDIDLAFERADQRLKETGFGDIGLVCQELAKMYPGSSTLYK